MNNKGSGCGRFALGRQVIAVLLACIIAIPAWAGPQNQAGDYVSPYKVKFTYPLADLLRDIEHGPRGQAENESSVPFAQWSSPQVRKHYTSWGPPASQYPAVPATSTKPVKWKRERVVAVALRFQGYGYQHHHIPDWNPPADWPWKETSAGHNGKGLDCSNFSAFVYNVAFGIKPSGEVKDQGAQLDIAGPGANHSTRAERIELPSSYAERVKLLRTGDLLYIHNSSDEITHVVLWVGEIGQSPDNAPLVIDSHGDSVRDSRGNNIPRRR